MAWRNLLGRMAGYLVVVEPLGPEHEEGLFAAAQDGETWTYLSAFPDATRRASAFTAG